MNGEFSVDVGVRSAILSRELWVHCEEEGRGVMRCRVMESILKAVLVAERKSDIEKGNPQLEMIGAGSPSSVAMPSSVT